MNVLQDMSANFINSVCMYSPNNSVVEGDELEGMSKEASYYISIAEEV